VSRAGEAKAEFYGERNEGTAEVIWGAGSPCGLSRVDSGRDWNSEVSKVLDCAAYGHGEIARLWLSLETKFDNARCCFGYTVDVCAAAPME
jgi:hypothetical protein